MGYQQTSFLSLPAEIRNQIYGYIRDGKAVVFNVTCQPRFLSQGSIMVQEKSFPNKSKTSSQQANCDDAAPATVDHTLVFIKFIYSPRLERLDILRTCRQIHREAVAFLYDNSCVIYHPWESLPLSMTRIGGHLNGFSPLPVKNSPNMWHVNNPQTNLHESKIPHRWLGMLKTLSMVFHGRCLDFDRPTKSLHFFCTAGFTLTLYLVDVVGSPAVYWRFPPPRMDPDEQRPLHQKHYIRLLRHLSTRMTSSSHLGHFKHSIRSVADTRIELGNRTFPIYRVGCSDWVSDAKYHHSVGCGMNQCQKWCWYLILEPSSKPNQRLSLPSKPELSTLAAGIDGLKQTTECYCGS